MKKVKKVAVKAAEAVVENATAANESAINVTNAAVAPEIQEALVERRISANTVLNMTTRATKEEKEKTTLKEREAKLVEIVKAQKDPIKKKDVFAKKPAPIYAPAPVYVQVDVEKDEAKTILISKNVRKEEEEFCCGGQTDFIQSTNAGQVFSGNVQTCT